MRVRTTIRPDEVMEADERQVQELRTLGLLAEVLPDDPAPATAPAAQTASAAPSQAPPAVPDLSMGSASRQEG